MVHLPFNTIAKIWPLDIFLGRVANDLMTTDSDDEISSYKTEDAHFFFFQFNA